MPADPHKHCIFRKTAMMLHGKYAALDDKTQLPFCFPFSTYCTIHYYTQKGAVFPQLLIVSFL